MFTLADNGWLQEVTHLPSPNYEPRIEPIKLIVVHSISLPSGKFGGDSISQLFLNKLDCEAHPSYISLKNLRVSAHFLIQRTGTITQFVSTQNCAWHAGKSVWQGESDCNRFSLGIELEGCDTVDFEINQYQQLVHLIHTMATHFSTLQVVGHQDIAPNRKTDPGQTFDWNYLFSLIGKTYDGRTQNSQPT